MAVAAHRGGPAGRPADGVGRRRHRLRHRFLRDRPDVAPERSSAVARYAGGRGVARPARPDTRPRHHPCRGDRQVAGRRHRLCAEQRHPDPHSGAEEGLLLRRRGSLALGAQIPGRRHQPAGARRGRGGQRQLQPGVRARRHHPPLFDLFAPRRRAVSDARSRGPACGAGWPARFPDQDGGRQRRIQHGRTHRHREGEDQEVRGPDRPARPHVDPLHARRARALHPGLARLRARLSARGGRGLHLVHRHQRRRAQGPAADAAQPGRRRCRGPRPGARADHPRLVHGAARLGAWRRNPFSRRSRPVADLPAALGGGAVVRDPRRRRHPRRLRRVVVRLRHAAHSARSGLPVDLRAARLSRRIPGQLPAHRGREEPGARRLRPLHVAGAGRASLPRTRSNCSSAAR